MARQVIHPVDANGDFQILIKVLVLVRALAPEKLVVFIIASLSFFLRDFLRVP